MRETHVRRNYRITIAKEARSLKNGLHNGVYEDLLRIIDGARDSVGVSMVEVRRSIGYEDPTWEQLVFDVRVAVPAEQALAYWGRIGDAIQDLMEHVDDPTREQLARHVSVHVNWS